MGISHYDRLERSGQLVYCDLCDSALDRLEDRGSYDEIADIYSCERCQAKSMEIVTGVKPKEKP
jgi:Zn finger protein HypA/HybF involved in hydrogenase expression